MTVSREEVEKVMSATKVLSAIIEHKGPQTIPVEVFMNAASGPQELMIDYDGEAEGGPTFTFGLKKIEQENNE